MGFAPNMTAFVREGQAVGTLVGVLPHMVPQLVQPIDGTHEPSDVHRCGPCPLAPDRVPKNVLYLLAGRILQKIALCPAFEPEKECDVLGLDRHRSGWLPWMKNEPALSLANQKKESIEHFQKSTIPQVGTNSKIVSSNNINKTVRELQVGIVSQSLLNLFLPSYLHRCGKF